MLTDTLQEVTVTETRHSHALKSTAPMHVIDRHDMSVMGITDMADALHRLPGITLRDYGGAGGMKTVSVRGFGTKHTGVSYDGVMLSECQSGEIDLSRYSLDNVNHLALVIGDNSDIFIPARNAMTPATLQIQTLAATSPDGSPSGFKPHLTGQLKAGSFGYTSPFLRYEQHLSPTLAISVVGEYIYAENDYPYTIKNGIETIHDRRRNSRMNSGHAELNMLWQMGNSSKMSGKLYYYDNDRQLPGQVFYYSNTSRETLRDRNFFGQVGYQTRWRNGWAMKLNGKFNWAATLYDDGVVAGWVQDADYYRQLLDITQQYAFICIFRLGQSVKEEKPSEPMGISIRPKDFYPQFRAIVKSYMHCMIGFSTSSRIAVVVPFERPEIKYEERIQIIEQVRQIANRLEERLQIHFRVGIGGVHSMSELRFSYQEAARALQESGSRIIHSNDIGSRGAYEGDFPAEVERAIFECLKKGDLEGMRSQAGVFFDWMIHRYPSSRDNIRL